MWESGGKIQKQKCVFDGRWLKEFMRKRTSWWWRIASRWWADWLSDWKCTGRSTCGRVPTRFQTSKKNEKKHLDTETETYAQGARHVGEFRLDFKHRPVRLVSMVLSLLPRPPHLRFSGGLYFSLDVFLILRWLQWCCWSYLGRHTSGSGSKGEGGSREGWALWGRWWGNRDEGSKGKAS